MTQKPGPIHAFFDSLRNRLIVKIFLPIAFILFSSIFLWSWFSLESQEQKTTIQSLTQGADRVASTVQLGLHYAMRLNSREDTQHIVANYGKLKEIRGIRIINKSGAVMFDSDPEKTRAVIPQTDPLCQTCHLGPTPKLSPTLVQRVYMDSEENGERVLRLASPILNEPGCSDPAGCHFHRADEKVLGVLDLGFSLADMDTVIQENRRHTLSLAFVQFAVTFATLAALFLILIKHPIARLIGDIKQIAQGKTLKRHSITSKDEIGQLAQAIYQMGEDLTAKNNQLSLQKNLYQDLFEGVPCVITVQDREFRLLRFNKTFAERFNAKEGEYCYKAYKNRDSKCPDCPVEKTFETGGVHSAEESGYYRDGSKAHWIVTTAPVYDGKGDLVAAMEMCQDITTRTRLTSELKRSEKKYMDIFNNIPSAVFVLDQADLSIRDCNEGAVSLYGRDKSELAGMSFLDLFTDADKAPFAMDVKKGKNINQVKHIAKDGREFFVSINCSPSEFDKSKVYLVTVSDISKRLEMEQQLIQASKMAILGEMATGVAHEINQPLAVIQTSVDLIKRSLARDEIPGQPLLRRVTELVAEQVSRATKIINHMREFGRKSEISTEAVDVNHVLRRSFDFFSQQLALHNIEVLWELDDKLPLARCEANRMEQVFINLLINARDAIEERAAKSQEDSKPPARISIKTTSNSGFVSVRISDTGTGIPESKIARIFEPFFTTKQVGKGTGLGLSISYGIIKDYGGTINVANNRDGGASFFIRLPVADVGTAAA